MGIKNIIGELQVNGKKVLTEGAGGGKLYKHMVNIYTDFPSGTEVTFRFTFYSHSADQLVETSLAAQMQSSTLMGWVNVEGRGDCYPIMDAFWLANTNRLYCYYLTPTGTDVENAGFQGFDDFVDDYQILEVT